MKVIRKKDNLNKTWKWKVVNCLPLPDNETLHSTISVHNTKKEALEALKQLQS